LKSYRSGGVILEKLLREMFRGVTFEKLLNCLILVNVICNFRKVICNIREDIEGYNIRQVIEGW